MAAPKSIAPIALDRLDAAGQIAAYLRKIISSGAYAVGERLPSETELSETFEVSRGTVREALRLLSSTGIVTSQRGSGGGTFVSSPQSNDVAERVGEAIRLWFVSGDVDVEGVVEARTYLEVTCAGLAAERRTESDLAAMREAIRSSAEPGLTAAEWLEVDVRFHSAVAHACHNPILEFAMRAVHLARPLVNQYLVDETFDEANRDMARSQHTAIADAIEARQVDEARSAAETHLRFLATLRRLPG